MSRFMKLTACALFLSIMFILGCSRDKSSKIIKSLRFEDIKSARIELSKTGGGSNISYNFDFDNPVQAAVIREVIGYLNSAKVQGAADEKVSNKGSSPTFLVLELTNGSEIKIKPAVEGKVVRLSDGSTETSHFYVPDEVTIIINSMDNAFRILSPEIRKLIDGGYREIFD